MNKITIERAVVEQVLQAMELGYDSAKGEADQYHAAMAGYRPQRHAQMDAQVQQIATAITALKASLAESTAEASSAVEPVQKPVWIQPDHLQKARQAPFLSRVEPTRRFADFVPLYAAPPMPAEPVGIVTKLVKGGVTWNRWPADMPDGTKLYAGER